MTNGTDDLDFDYDDEEYEEEDASPKQTNSLKWGLAAVVVLAVVALVLVGVVLLGGEPGKGALDGASSSRNAAASGIASADDTGPVSIIMTDPSCIAWGSISANPTWSEWGH